MKKLLSLVMALVLLMSCTAFAETDWLCKDEPITLTAFATAGPYTKGDFNDLAMWRVMEEKTGITFQFEAAPSGQSGEKLGLLFASNSLPDVIFKTGITNTELATYAEEGQLIALDPYLEQYAPNLNARLEAQPELRKAITMSDGHIYGFPYLVTAAPSNCTPKLFINYKALEALGKDEPTTMDELLDVMRAFKDSDYNGNGKADEIAYARDNSEWIIGLYGVYGLGTRGTAQAQWDVDPETGALRFIPVADGYKELLSFLATCYQEGLLDQEVFTADIATLTAKAEQNQLLFVSAQNSTYMGSYQNDFKGLELPLVKNEGDTPFWPNQRLSVYANNTFITSNCEHPEAVVQYFDYFYGDEGITLFFMGIEGETFTYDENGVPHFTEYVTNNPDGMNMEEALGTFVCWSGGGNPSVADDVHFGDQLINETTATFAKKMQAYGPETIWPGAFTYSTEEAEYLAEYQLEIGTYVSDMQAKFITGAESLDNWDAYVEQIKGMDLEGYTALVQAALDRYNAM